MRTISEENKAEILVKKSKFIANIFYIENEEEANNIIKKIKKDYFDARHNCYAYRISSENNILEKYSDDGEPAGTAGQPILNVIRGNELQNVIIVVTRYFGGILLGTGGLVKAYTESAKKVLEETKIINKQIGKKIKYEILYQDLEKLNYYMRQNKIKIYNSNFLENIEVYVEITDEKAQIIEKNKNDLNFKILNSEIIEEDCYINVE